jgi:hypothetical protein
LLQAASGPAGNFRPALNPGRLVPDTEDVDEQRQTWAEACIRATRLLETASDDPERSIFISLTQREVYLVTSVLLMSLANGLPDAGATKLLDKIGECFAVQAPDFDPA